MKHKVWCDIRTFSDFTLPCTCIPSDEPMTQEEEDRLVRIGMSVVAEVIENLKDAQVHGAVSDFAAAEWKERHDLLEAENRRLREQLAATPAEEGNTMTNIQWMDRHISYPCQICLGRGHVALPPKIITPNAVSAEYSFKRCEACNGTGEDPVSSSDTSEGGKMKLKGLAKQASDEWSEAPLGWSSERVRCSDCGYTCISVHPFGMKIMECGGCHKTTRHEVIE